MKQVYFNINIDIQKIPYIIVVSLNESKSQLGISQMKYYLLKIWPLKNPYKVYIKNKNKTFNKFSFETRSTENATVFHK